jgi:glycosyltransferase involved in cell wall biosynthesis
MVAEGFVLNNGASIRVGFIQFEGHWLGGLNYLRNLFAAIRTLPGNPITPVVFMGEHQTSALSDFPEIEIVVTSLLERKSPLWFVRKTLAKITSQDVLLRRLLQQHNVSVLSHSSHLGRQAEVKTIGWIPDFQHLYLPEFFTLEERIQRDREFMSICTQCDKVIVSSESACSDLLSFSPEHANKVELLRFVASPISLADAISLQDLQKLYSFDSPYFLLPNQFWAHKNHRVVISALQKLKQKNKPFLVLATGSSEDYRNPTFFSTLMQYASECDVLDSFRVLGRIPFNHLAGLARHTIAFINPSRFEGWSTSVEEAKSMGKQIILSDIAVHQEQSPQRSFFFPEEDSEALAAAMEAAYNEFDDLHDATMQERARAQFHERQREFGDAFLRIIVDCLQSPQSRTIRG